MRPQLLDVEDAQAVRREHALRRHQREVPEMLVIDRVELVLLDEAQQMRELEGGDAARAQQDRHARQEVVEVGHLRQHVVADDEIGEHAAVDELARRVLVEEACQGRHAARFRRLGHVLGRVDAEHGVALLDEELQQVAVIAGELDDTAVARQLEALDRHVDIAPRMRQPRLGIGREIGVFVEDVLGRHVFLYLRQEARAAHHHLERIERLHRVDLVGGEEALAQRRHAEIDEIVQRAAAEPATVGAALGALGG